MSSSQPAPDVRRLILSERDMPPDEVRALLAPFGLADPAAADSVLRALADMQASREGLADLLPGLLDAARRSPDPDRALARFHAYCRARVDPHTFFGTLRSVPHLLDELLFIFGSSDYLSAILVRQPEYLSWLLETDALDAPKGRSEMLAELREWAASVVTPDAKLAILRRFKRRETLRIGVRDLVRAAHVDDVTREMAYVADSAFEVALDAIRPALVERYGAPRNADGSPATVSVIGMGKLGGEELNFSSDVDILCVYSEDGTTDDGTDNLTFFQRLAERLTDAIGSQTQDGYVFRVDFRLRPQGKTGALARSLDSYEAYYETWGELLERQALVKARHIAGDAELGAAFLRMVRPFVYRAALDATQLEETLDEIRWTKASIERRIAQDGDPSLHIKLGPGGIRDSEFVVQALQLLHGSRLPAARVAGTVAALDALAAAGVLPVDEAAMIKDAYRYMRRVENCVQLVSDRQVYHAPDDPDEWERLARRLGYDDDAGVRFREDFRARQRTIRAAFDKLFTVDEAGFAWRMNTLLAEAKPSEETGELLAAYGLDDPATAHRLLRELASGSDRVRYTPRVRRMFIRFAEPLLQDIGAAPDPALALSQLDRFLSASGARAQIYPVLREEPRVRELIVRILGTSRFLGDVLARDPLAYEALVYGPGVTQRAESVEACLAAMGDPTDPGVDALLRHVQRYRHEALLRIGTRDILGESDVLTTTRELSILAEAILQRCFAEFYAAACEQHGEPMQADGRPARYAVVGLGKLAGRELNYSSDLDVQVVFSEEGETTQGMSNADFYRRMVRAVVNHWKKPVLGGAVYDLDMRLRPYGRGGPMALTLAGYEAYYRDHGELWERQAALKSRIVAGSQDVGARYIRIATAFTYDAGLTATDASAIHAVRARKEDKAARESDRLHNLKSGHGGMVDIEFLTQALQMRHAGGDEGLRSPNTVKAIAALREAECLSEAEAQRLTDTYVFLRFVEDRLQIVDNRPMSALPTDKVAMAKLTRRLGYADTATFLTEYEENTERVRDVFENVFQRLQADE
jgi:[glutamine synthetase] adenylyltransferase / [glutamine synthetase]-adenylyl-L-tyrosine phosphorylase